MNDNMQQIQQNQEEHTLHNEHNVGIVPSSPSPNLSLSVINNNSCEESLYDSSSSTDESDMTDEDEEDPIESESEKKENENMEDIDHDHVRPVACNLQPYIPLTMEPIVSPPTIKIQQNGECKQQEQEVRIKSDTSITSAASSLMSTSSSSSLPTSSTASTESSPIYITTAADVYAHAIAKQRKAAWNAKHKGGVLIVPVTTPSTSTSKSAPSSHPLISSSHRPDQNLISQASNIQQSTDGKSNHTRNIDTTMHDAHPTVSASLKSESTSLLPYATFNNEKGELVIVLDDEEEED